MKTHRLTNIGVVTGALLASACCWLPLLLVTLGLGSFGLGAFFESARPWFLGLTAALLVVAVLLQWRAGRRVAAAEDCCATEGGPTPRRSLLRRMPWVLLLIAGSALYLPDLLVAGSHSNTPKQTQSSWLLTLPEGADAAAVTKALQQAIPELIVSAAPDRVGHGLLLSVPKAQALAAAAQVTQTLATLALDAKKAPIQELTWRSYQVGGMTCKTCTKHVAHALDGRPDILAVTVDLDSASAAALTLPDFDLKQAEQAVAAAGYQLKESQLPPNFTVPGSDNLAGCCTIDN